MSQLPKRHNVIGQLTRVPNTQTDTKTTLRATSVATGRIYGTLGDRTFPVAGARVEQSASHSDITVTTAIV